LNVCLTCFNGGCAGERNHAELHYKISRHPLIVNIRRTKKPKAEVNYFHPSVIIVAHKDSAMSLRKRCQSLPLWPKPKATYTTQIRRYIAIYVTEKKLTILSEMFVTEPYSSYDWRLTSIM
jgi:ubiquitin carboxyl-terminal hydrolase 5/13